MALSETAQLIVSLRLQDQLTGGLTKAKGELSALETQAASSSSRIGGAFKNMGTAITAGVAAFAGFKAAEFLGGAVEAAREEEQSIARLTASLKANATAWDGNVEAVEAHIAANTAAAFSDDELRQSLGSLVAATHDVTAAFEDQQTAIDLARFTGKSLEEATQTIIAVEAGRFRGLAQLGISIKGVTTAEQALAKIREVTAGQSAAFLATDAGKAEKLKVSIDELAESFGRFASGPLADASAGLADFFNLISGAAESGFDNMADNIKASFARATKESLEATRAAIVDALAKNQRLFAGTPFLGDLPIGIGNVAGETDRLTQLLAAVDAALANTGSQAEDTGQSLIFLQKQTGIASTAVDDAVAAFQRYATAVEAAGGRNVEERVSALGDAFRELNRPMTDAEQKAFDLAKALNDIPRNIDINFQFGLSGAVNAGLPPGSADTNRGSTFLPGGDQSALDAANAAAATQAALDKARADAAKAARDKAAADAKSAADRAKAEAKKAADELAAAYREQVSNAFDKAKRASDSLFDSLHDRHLRAIKDAETLAQKQHDAAVDQIADQLKLAKAQNAVEVNRAQTILDADQRAQQLRNLQEALQDAAEAAQKAPNDVGAQRALRGAREALVAFNAQENIAALQAVQAQKDKAAEDAAQKARDEADATLEAAKLKAAADTAFANKADAKKKQDFDLALEALKKKDIADPAKFLVDVKALQAKFGIFADERGFQHIGDVVAGAIKNVKFETPHITLNTTPSFILKLGPVELKGIAAAVASTANPSQGGSTRTGQSTPKPS